MSFDFSKLNNLKKNELYRDEYYYKINEEKQREQQEENNNYNKNNSIWNDVKNTFNNLMLYGKQGAMQMFKGAETQLESNKNYKMNNERQFYNSRNVSDIVKAQAKSENSNDLLNSMMKKKINNNLPKKSDYGIGNIDLNNRPVYKNEDGSISTVRSMSFWDDDEQKEILVPTIAFDKNGKAISLTNDEAVDRYYETGEYLGKFDDWREADKYAERLHKEQDKLYSNNNQSNVIEDKSPLLKINDGKIDDEIRKYKNSISNGKIDTNLTRNYLQNNINKTSEEIQKNTNNINNEFLRKANEQVVPALGQMGAGMIVSTINPALGTLYFSESATGGYYDDAKQRGMDDNEARKYSTIMGAMEGATEQIGIENFSKARKGVKALVKGTGKEVVKEGTKEITKSSMKTVLKNYGIGIADNIIQEAIIDPIQELTAQTVAGKDKAQWEGIKQKMLQDGINGGLVSAILGGVNLGIQSCTGVVEKLYSNQKITGQEIQNAVKETGQQLDTSKMMLDSVKQQVNKYKDYYTGKQLDSNTQNVLNQTQNVINNNQNLQQNTTQNQFDSQKQQIIPVQDENTSKSNITGRNDTKNTTIKDFNESAKQYNIDYKNEDLKEIKQMFEKRGINAYFDENTFQNNNDAFSVWKPTYDEQGNISGREVVFNPKAQDTNTRVQELAIHELGHDLDLNEVQDMILKDASRKENWESARKSLENTYKQAYENDNIQISDENFNKIIDEEATMNILQRELGSQEYVNRLVNQNQSIAKKIYNWVIDKLNKFTGGKNEKIFWADIKNKFENAYNQEFNKNDNTAKFSIAGKKSLENIKNDSYSYSRGINSYNNAINLAKQNIDNEQIRQKTGWFQDKNGDWKYEFSDKDMSLKNIKIQKDKIYKLGDILEHDTLFTLYPEVENYKVEINDNIKANASFDRRNNTITINSKLIKNNKSLEGTLIHEIQHAIQNIENFERGTSTKGSKLKYYNSLGEIEATETKGRFLKEKYQNKNMFPIAPESSKANPQHKDLNKYLKNRNLLDKVKDSMYNYFNKRGVNNYDVSEEIVEKDRTQNNSLVDERRRLESENNSGSFNLPTNKKLEERVSGDKLLDTQDFINEIKDVGAEIDENGYVTVYHQTTKENANKIRKTGKMSAMEDGIFFSTSKNAQQSEGRGDVKLEFKIPAEKLELDDIFTNNADVKIPLKNKNQLLDVSDYLVISELKSENNSNIKNSNTIKEVDDISGTSLNRSSTSLSNNSLPSTQKNVNSQPLQKYSMQESENNSGSFNLQENKQKQLDIIQKNNKMKDDYHTGIRNIKDIKTFKEAIQDDESFVYGDYSLEDAQRDLERGKVTVYSSKPISQGGFVSTSKNMAQDYAGNGKVYSKEVSINDVAWINGDEGQYANINQKYALPTKEWQQFLEDNYQKQGTGKNLKEYNLPTKEDLKTNVKFNNDNLIQESKNITDDDIAKILTENSPNVSEKRKFGAFLKANLIDKGMVFEELSRKTNNRELQGKYDYTLTSEARGQNAIGNARYDYQTISENGKIKKGEKNAKQISKSLTDIIDEVGENPTDFYNYMYHQLNIDRMTLEDRFGGDTGINYERKNTIKNKPVFGEKVTAEISKEKVQELEKKHPEFKEYAKDVYDYLDANTNELVRNGVISKETQQLFKEMYPHYVPISRVKDNGSAISVPLDTGRTGINNPIKRAKGGNSDIKPLFQTMADRTLQTYRASARNSFGIELKNTLEKAKQLNQLKEFADMDFIMENMTDEEQNSTLLQEGKNGRNPTFTVFENGEKVTFDISKDMYDALKPKNELLKRIDDSKLSKILNKVNNFRRGLLTEYNPVFCLTNSMKDIQDVLGNSQHSMKTYSKIPESTAQIVSKGYWYKEYIQNGGEQNSYFKDGEFDKVKNNVPTVAKKIFTFPLKTISKVNNVIEMTPRLAEYIVSREQGKSIETSMLDASRVTTNFKAGGDFTKTLNRNGFTFLNASVQGMQQQIRNIQEANAKGLKGWAVLATKYAIAGLPILLLNNLFWKDDDDYKDLQDYAKDNYYIIGKTQNGTFIRIPKGRAVATVQKIVSNANDFIKDVNDKKIIDIDKFGKQFWEDLKEDISFAYDNLAPNNPMDNNIIAPIIQAITNKSWYGEDIVSSNLQDKPTKEQYDESTDKLSIWIGNKTGISPKKINYLLDQYSGGVGDVLLPMMTPQAENNVLEDKFTVNSVMKSKYPGEFFNKLDELKVNSNSSNASDEDIVKYKYINGISSDINKLYSQKRDIQNSNFSDDEKKKRLHEVQLKINELSKNCLSKIDEISTGKIYAQIDNSQYYKDIKGNWNELSDEEKEKNKTYNISLESYSDYKYKTGELKQEKLDNGELEEKEQLKDKDKIQILVDSNYSENEKENIYKNYINSKDKKTILVDKLGLPINEYLKYKSQIFENDKDEDGETISGSKKEKVYSYLNSVSDEDLSQDYKKIICKIEDINDYDNDIVNFINNSKNLNYSERTEILKNIGFKIDKDGKIQTKSILPIYKYVK